MDDDQIDRLLRSHEKRVEDLVTRMATQQVRLTELLVRLLAPAPSSAPGPGGEASTVADLATVVWEALHRDDLEPTAQECWEVALACVQALGGQELLLRQALIEVAQREYGHPEHCVCTGCRDYHTAQRVLNNPHALAAKAVQRLVDAAEGLVVTLGDECGSPEEVHDATDHLANVLTTFTEGVS